MRVSRTQIVDGVADYIKRDILPKMADDRAVQIIFTIAVNAAMANDRLVDSVFDNEIVRSMLEDDGSGTYEIGGIVDAMRSAINEFGAFPVSIPAIPLVSPREITLTLNGEDIEAIKRRIENVSRVH